MFRSTRKRTWALICVLAMFAASVVLAACGDEGSSGSEEEAGSGGLRTVKVVFPRARELAGEDVYLHAAEELGYAEENGIKFEFESAIGTTDSTKLVATGKADVGYPSPFVTITARESGLGIKSVFNTLQTNIFGFGVKPDSPIQGIADLKGKKVALGDGGWTTIAAPLLRAEGLTVDDVEWIVAGERRQVAVDEGDADAVLTWEMEYQNFADQGIELRVFGQDSVPFQSNGLVVSDKLIEEDPELVKAIVRTAAMGAAFVTANPEAAAKIALDRFPGVTPQSEKGMLDVVNALVALLNGGGAQEHGYGWHDEEAWAEEIEVLKETGTIDEIVPVEDVITNEFIEYANDFDRARVEKDAKEYKP